LIIHKFLRGYPVRGLASAGIIDLKEALEVIRAVPVRRAARDDESAPSAHILGVRPRDDDQKWDAAGDTNALGGGVANIPRLRRDGNIEHLEEVGRVSIGHCALGTQAEPL